MQDLVDLAKVLFVEVAEQEMLRAKADSSVSRLSLMTGVHRKDVTRLRSGKTQPRRTLHFVARILGQWQHDSRFTTKDKKARPLEFEGANSEFAKLVRSVGKELNPYTVLFELERSGLVKREKNTLKLTAKMYLPVTDAKKIYEITERDAGDLFQAVEENVFGKQEPPNLHLRTEFDNIPAEHAGKIRAWLLERGSDFHDEARAYLSQFDRDLNPKVKKSASSTIRASVGSFGLIEARSKDDKESI